jgi:hypothetical protein
LVVIRHGSRSGSQQHKIPFGSLFYATDNVFEALAGTLRTAKKYGVVDYDGDLLMQRIHDDTVITLIKDSHEGIGNDN